MNADRRRSELRLAALRRLDLPRDYNDLQFAELDAHNSKESVLWSRWAAAFYLQQRSKGAPHHTAVRALAFKWQRIIWRCWQDHKPYDERIYEAALQKNASKLLALFDRVELGKSPFKNPVKIS